MRKEVTFPKFVFGGIQPNHRAIPLDKNLRIFGADSETFKGEPMTIQAHDGTDTLFEYVTGATIFNDTTGGGATSPLGSTSFATPHPHYVPGIGVVSQDIKWEEL